jgi:DNA-binding NarL/FixJ family response regulator
MSIRVAVIDDQALVRGGFAMVLNHQTDIEVVAEGSNGLEAIDLAHWPVRVLIVTTFDPDEYIYKALRAGASGFVLKDTRPEDLVTAVRVVAEGGALLSPSITRRLIGRFAQQLESDSTLSAKLDDLTTREKEVLVAIARGLNNQEISESLFIGAATVKTHVSNVLSKLGIRDRAQAVVFAYESGLIATGGQQTLNQ